MQFVEQNEFSIDQFCTACIIRKPLRSKHCSDCDRCVAKFDHHCPWVDNCIGQYNLKYFVGFLFWTPVCLTFYMHGAIARTVYAFFALANFIRIWIKKMKILFHFCCLKITIKLVTPSIWVYFTKCPPRDYFISSWCAHRGFRFFRWSLALFWYGWAVCSCAISIKP